MPFRDTSIPSLESILDQDPSLAEETNTLSQLINRQASAENVLMATQAQAASEECQPPPVCHDYQTSRLFLSHFGLLNLDDKNEVILRESFECKHSFIRLKIHFKTNYSRNKIDSETYDKMKIFLKTSGQFEYRIMQSC